MTVMVISFGIVLFLLWLRSCEHPVFHDLMELDKFSWPRWLLWHGWLPLLSGMNHGSPWAEDPAEGAGNLLECALGACILATSWTGSCRWGLMLVQLPRVEWRLLTCENGASPDCIIVVVLDAIKSV